MNVPLDHMVAARQRSDDLAAADAARLVAVFHRRRAVQRAERRARRLAVLAQRAAQHCEGTALGTVTAGAR